MIPGETFYIGKGSNEQCKAERWPWKTVPGRPHSMRGIQMIIAFAGRANAGKDLAGKYLIEHYKFLHYYFAKPLKEGCKHLFQLTDEQIANKETIIEPWGMSPRTMYQKIGTDIGRTLDPNIWIKNAQMFIDKNQNQNIVITDCRFGNEALWIRNRQGIVIHINRNNELIAESKHTSENSMVESDYDYSIENIGTKEDLYKKIDIIAMTLFI